MNLWTELWQTMFTTFLPILAAAVIFGAFRAWQVFGRRRGGSREE